MRVNLASAPLQDGFVFSTSSSSFLGYVVLDDCREAQPAAKGRSRTRRNLGCGQAQRSQFNFTNMISNLFNHPNFLAPGNDISVQGVAEVIGASGGQHGFFSAEKSGPRLVEFRLRLEF